MTEKRPPTPLNKLDERLREARARRPGATKRKKELEQGGGLSLALRIGVELVAALIVGVGIGLLLDRWLGTTPWFLLLFFLLGSAAGILNVFRVMKGYGYAVGSRAERAAWGPLVEGYLRDRATCVGMLMLADVRRGPEAEEEQLREFLDHVGRPHAGDARRLTDRQRPALQQPPARLVAEPRHGAVVEVGRDAPVLHAPKPVDLDLLARDVPGVLDLHFDDCQRVRVHPGSAEIYPGALPGQIAEPYLGSAQQVLDGPPVGYLGRPHVLQIRIHRAGVGACLIDPGAGPHQVFAILDGSLRSLHAERAALSPHRRRRQGTARGG